MTRGLRLGKAFGGPVVADASAIVLAVLFGGAVFIHLRAGDTPVATAGWFAAGASVAVVFCVYLHEICHGAVASMKGASVRSIRIYMYGGYSVIDGIPSPAVEALVAFAGPAASLLLAAVLWVLSGVAGSSTTVGETLFALALANAAIGLFNLLPGLPLDGGRVLRGLLSVRNGDRVKATRLVTRIGVATGFAAIALGVVVLIQRNPAGVFWLFGGWFLASTASAAGKREELSTRFDGRVVGDVMRSTPEAAPGNWTVSSLLDQYPLDSSLRSMPVEMDGHVVGLIGQTEIDSVAPSRWPSMRIRSLMTPIGPRDVVGVSDPLESLFLRNDRDTSRVVVVDGGRVVGVVDQPIGNLPIS
jgi:Zn-dependent protease